MLKLSKLCLIPRHINNNINLSNKNYLFNLYCNLSTTLSSKPTIIYTGTDEAPALATYALLPIVKSYAAKAGIDVIKKDISVASRIIAQFPKYLTDEQRENDNLAELGDICKTPEANIIKLPNISASIPQLNGAINELRLKGYDVPAYIPNPISEKDKVIYQRYAKVLGMLILYCIYHVYIYDEYMYINKMN